MKNNYDIAKSIVASNKLIKPEYCNDIILPVRTSDTTLITYLCKILSEEYHKSDIFKQLLKEFRDYPRSYEVTYMINILNDHIIDGKDIMNHPDWSSEDSQEVARYHLEKFGVYLEIDSSKNRFTAIIDPKSGVVTTDFMFHFDEIELSIKKLLNQRSVDGVKKENLVVTMLYIGIEEADYFNKVDLLNNNTSEKTPFMQKVFIGMILLWVSH